MKGFSRNKRHIVDCLVWSFGKCHQFCNIFCHSDNRVCIQIGTELGNMLNSFFQISFCFCWNKRGEAKDKRYVMALRFSSHVVHHNFIVDVFVSGVVTFIYNQQVKQRPGNCNKISPPNQVIVCLPSKQLIDIL